MSAVFLHFYKYSDIHMIQLCNVAATESCKLDVSSEVTRLLQEPGSGISKSKERRKVKL